MLRGFAVRLLASGVGLWLADRWLNGVTITGGFWSVFLAALIFSLVNTFVRPLLKLFTLPLILLSLGIFSLVINVFMVFVLDWLYPNFDVRGFWAAAATIIIIWLVDVVVGMIFDHEEK